MMGGKKERVLKLIAEGKIQDSLDELLNQDLHNEVKKQIIGLASRYRKTKKERRFGTISQEGLNLEINRITAGLIEIVNENEIASRKHKIFKNKRYWKIGALSLLLISMLSLAVDFNNAKELFSIFSQKSLQLTVYVHGAKGQQDIVIQNQGKLIIDFGNDRRTALIGENGRTNFGEIPAHFSDRTINIGFEGKGYELVNPNELFLLNGSPVYLAIRKDKSLGRISGIVKNRDGSKWIENALILIGNDTTIYTNEIGAFKVILPEDMQVPNETTPYLLTIKKDNYKVRTEHYYPKSGNIEIRLINE